jgi:hypothetical protein
LEVDQFQAFRDGDAFGDFADLFEDGTLHAVYRCLDQ